MNETLEVGDIDMYLISERKLWEQRYTYNWEAASLFSLSELKLGAILAKPHPVLELMRKKFVDLRVNTIVLFILACPTML